ncbi:MAG: tyrosine-type recombinase/integrase [Lachnospiraceae bacterium]|nr:tyrosine-type recombinase/integrase [Lachnospiraceae bacterium]
MNKRIISPIQINEFREFLRREEKSTATVEKYLRDVRAFCIYVGGQEITKELVIDYKKYLQEQGYAIRSVNSMLASLNRFLLFRGLEECRVKNIRVQKQTYCAQEKELTKAEYLRLLKAAEKKEQLKLVIETICATGIRVSELKFFTVESVRLGEVSVQCKNKNRVVFVPDKLKWLLLAFAKKCGIKRGHIFITRGKRPLDRSYIWSQMKKLCAAAGVNPKKVFPHNLRKLFARTFYGKEKDIAKLSDLLGHSSIETTRIYIMTTGTEHRRQVGLLGLVV